MAKSSSKKGAGVKAKAKPPAKSAGKSAQTSRPADARAKRAKAEPAKAKAPGRGAPALKAAKGNVARRPAPASNGAKAVVGNSKPAAAVPVKMNGSKANGAAMKADGSKPAKRPVEAPRPMGIDAVMAAAASGKRVRNQAGLSSKEVEHFREMLILKRRELLGDVHSMESEALLSGPDSGNLSNLPDHMADQGTDNYEQEFTLGLMEKDRKLLREIDAAIAKTRNGAYGICEGTGKPISKARLEAQPWARYSIEHARKLERGIYRM